MKKYFLGLSSTYSIKETLSHTFAFGNDFDLSELRAYLAAHYGATYDHVAVYSNGRTALAVALKAVAKRGGKVVVTSLTCYAVVQAVRAAGCIPVYADVDPKTLHFGEKELLKLLERETDVQAVIVQNNLGIPADIEGIERVAKRYKLSIIEDLAHCVGRKYRDGREIGTVGRATILSFGKGKAVDVVTGGALVLTDPLNSPVNQPELKPILKDRLRARFYPLISAIIRGGYRLNNKLGRLFTSFFVKVHAIKKSADGVVNTKVRLTYWQAKLALRKLQATSHMGRRPLRDFYLVNDRDKVLGNLEKKGYIFNDIWYDTPVAPQRYFHKVDYHPEFCPVATKIATQIINVPTWYEKKELVHALQIIKKDLVDENEITNDELKEMDASERTVSARRTRNPRKVSSSATSKKSSSKSHSSSKSSRRNKSKVKRISNAIKALKGDAIDDDVKAESKKPKKKTKTKAKTKAKVKAMMEGDEPENNWLDMLQDGSNVESEESTETFQEEMSQEETYQENDISTVASETVNTWENTPPERKVQPEYQKPDYRDDKIGTDSMTGMRVAPQRLSEREKIKRDLEAGERGKQSVI